MTREPVESSSLKSIGHDGDTLEVEFHSGKVYQHAGFSTDDHAALMGAESIGRHYNAHVKGKFAHTLIDEQEENDGARG